MLGFSYFRSSKRNLDFSSADFPPLHFYQCVETLFKRVKLDLAHVLALILVDELHVNYVTVW